MLIFATFLIVFRKFCGLKLVLFNMMRCQDYALRDNYISFKEHLHIIYSFIMRSQNRLRNLKQGSCCVYLIRHSFNKCSNHLLLEYNDNILKQVVGVRGGIKSKP